ncbi:hypothetical protein JCM11641_006346 [Rhodosporidiobolus odoratus]
MTILQTDNGIDSTSEAFESMLADKNTTHSYSVPYIPQQNGCSEGFPSPFFPLSMPLVLGQDVWVHDPDAPAVGNMAVQGILLGGEAGRGHKAYRVQKKGAPGSALCWAKDVPVVKQDSEKLGSRDVEDNDYFWDNEDLAKKKQASELID